jgi:hypothetical protein
MNRRFLLASLTVLCACPEYNLQGDPELYATPNPPDMTVPVHLDRIVQVTVPAVDVLWVVDNSCSMDDDQAAVTTNFPKFMNYFLDSGLDYHIGVVSTDMVSNAEKGKLQSGQGHKWIDPATPNAVDVFTDMAHMGSNGSYDEKGRAAVYTALELMRDTNNAGFLREEANLSIIVISDENDYSGNKPIALNEFISWLANLKPDEEMTSFSSIVGAAGNSCGAEVGSDYLAVTRAVGGIEWDLCDQNWEEVLEQLGMQAAGLKREFFLSEVPVVDTINVWVEDEGETIDFEMDVDFEYSRSRNSIEFYTYVANPLAEVFINYQLLSAWSEATDETTESEGH